MPVIEVKDTVRRNPSSSLPPIPFIHRIPKAFVDYAASISPSFLGYVFSEKKR